MGESAAPAGRALLSKPAGRCSLPVPPSPGWELSLQGPLCAAALGSALAHAARPLPLLQVIHFDKLYDKKGRLLQTLQQNISRAPPGVLGGLQGEPQK